MRRRATSPLLPPPTNYYLDVCMVGHDGGPQLEAGHHLRGHPGLAHSHMVFAEEELAVQVAGLNRIQVDLGGWDGGARRGGQA